jgi:hypothetical protein
MEKSKTKLQTPGKSEAPKTPVEAAAADGKDCLVPAAESGDNIGAIVRRLTPYAYPFWFVFGICCGNAQRLHHYNDASYGRRFP